MQKIKAYYRLAKPGIIYGNLLSMGAGFFLASRMHPRFELLLALIFGIGLVIACACVLNNIIDRDIDKKMARTKSRPLITGDISVPSALVYGSLLGIMGFLVLVLYTNMLVVALGALALFFYVVVYGIAKRKSVYGTLVGTIPGAVPLIAGYVAVAGQLDIASLSLFLLMAAWQMAHFYAIGTFRSNDYSQAGLPIFPVKRGAETTKRHITVYIILFIIFASALTIFGYTGIVYLLIILVVGGMWLRKSLQGFKTKNDEKWARGMFFFSLKVLLTFCFAVSLAGLLP